MNRLLLLLTSMILSFGLLAACSSDSDSNNGSTDQNGDVTDTDNNQTPDDENVEDDENGTDENNEDTGNAPEENEGDTSPGNFQDQEDLRIGDTGQVETTLGKYEVTIDSIKKEDEIDGRASQLEYFFVVDITIKNIGDQAIDANESKNVLEITEMLDGSGFSDVASFFDSIEEIEGNIEPGEAISGQMLFEEEEAEEYYIRFTEGLVAAGAVKNQVIWTFTLEEAEK